MSQGAGHPHHRVQTTAAMEVSEAANHAAAAAREELTPYKEMTSMRGTPPTARAASPAHTRGGSSVFPFHVETEQTLVSID